MSYQTIVAALPGVLAIWELDDAAGSATVADNTGNGHTATCTNLTLGVAGLVSDGGTAGKTGYAIAPASSAWNFGTGPFWMCGWFATTNANLCIVSGWSNSDIWFGLNSGKSYTSVGNGHAGTVTINDGNRHFFFLCRDGSGNVNLWIDGSSTSDFTTFNSTTSFNLASEPFGLNALGTGGYGAGGTIDGLAVGNGVVTASQAAAVYTAGATSTPALVAPNSTAIAYSPYNWSVTATSATSVNPGAYFSVLFGKTSITLSFDTTNAYTSTLCWYRVDGGAWVSWTYAASLAVTGLTTGQTHLFEFVFAGTTISNNRWNSGQKAAVILTQIALDTADTATAPGTAPYHVLVYGDSITEGYNTRPTSTGQPNQNDALPCWSYTLRELLGCEVGVVGFGSQGWTIAGQGNVPALSSSWNLQFAGTSRSFNPAPDVVVIAHGTNDGGHSVSSTNLQAAMSPVISGLLAAGAKKVICLGPLNGMETAAVQAGSAAAGVAFADASAVLSSGDFTPDGVHPNAASSRSKYGPWVAAQIKSQGLLGSVSIPINIFRSPIFLGGR